MRYLPALLLLFALLAAVPRSARSAGGGPPRPDVTVSLAIVERGRLTADSVFHVIIQNTTEKPDAKLQSHFDEPQSHFDEWNSWGYDNLTLEWTDAQGHTGTVTKVPRKLGMEMLPTTTDLKPGEALVRDISFDPKIWQGWPAGAGPITLTLKVTYHSTGEPKSPDSAAGWTGTAVSKAQTVVVWRAPAP